MNANVMDSEAYMSVGETPMIANIDGIGQQREHQHRMISQRASLLSHNSSQQYAPSHSGLPPINQMPGIKSPITLPQEREMRAPKNGYILHPNPTPLNYVTSDVDDG